jgi:hypothetical protein
VPGGNSGSFCAKAASTPSSACAMSDPHGKSMKICAAPRDVVDVIPIAPGTTRATSSRGSMISISICSAGSCRRRSRRGCAGIEPLERGRRGASHRHRSRPRRARRRQREASGDGTRSKRQSSSGRSAVRTGNAQPHAVVELIISGKDNGRCGIERSAYHVSRAVGGQHADGDFLGDKADPLHNVGLPLSSTSIDSSGTT